MMKLIAFFFLAVVAVASAGLLGEGPEVYSAVTTKQVHSPHATSSSTRVQSFNDYTYVAPVVSAAPVVAAAPVVSAPVISAPVVSAPVVSKYVAAAAPVAYSTYGASYGASYGGAYGGYGYGLW